MKFRPGKDTGCPAFFKGSFEINECADTFLRLEGFIKGVAFINGFNLGRYWNIGPQKTLFVPAPLLKKGFNEIVVFELHGMQKPVVELVGTHDLGQGIYLILRTTI